MIDASNYTLTAAFVGTRRIRLPVSDFDNSPLQVTFVSLPAGSLAVASTGAPVRVGDSIAAAEELLYTTPNCRQIETKQVVGFDISVSDGETSATGRVQLTVDCEGHVKRASHAIDVAVWVICSICAFVCLIYAVIIFIYRERKEIRAISPVFCLLTCAGGILANLSPIFLTVGLTNCISWLSYLTIGLCFFFGAVRWCPLLLAMPTAS